MSKSTYMSGPITDSVDSVKVILSHSTGQKRKLSLRETRRSRLFMVICVGSVCWGLLGTMVAEGGGMEGEDYLRKALQAFETRENQLNPVCLRYEVDEFESKEWRSRGRENSKQKEPISDRRWKVKVEFARKEDKVRAVMSDDLTAKEGGGRTRLEVYNGEMRVETVTGTNRYDISRKSGEVSAYGSPWELTGEEALHNLVLRKWAAGKLQLKVLSVKEERLEDGADALAISIVYPTTGVKNKIWLLPESAYAVHRFEVYNREGLILQKSCTTEFEMVSGIPVPKRGNSINYYYGRVGKQRDFQVESVVLKRSDIPDSLFEVEIPKDAVIFDSDLKVLIRDPKQAQTHLEQVLGKIRRDKHPWRVWWIFGASLGGIALLVSLITIKRRWKNAKPGD